MISEKLRGNEWDEGIQRMSDVSASSNKYFSRMSVAILALLV
jgi:hypothetical protein